MRASLWVVGIGVVLAACGGALDFGASCSAAPHGAVSGTDALVIGDWGWDDDPLREMASAMEKAAVDLDVAAIITTGDNFYSNDGDVLFCEPFDWVVDQGIPVWASWGNHDIEEPERGVLMEEHLSITENWYERRLGEWVVLVLDSNQVRNEEQRQWLQGRLHAAQNEPLMVVFHHPTQSCGLHGSWSRITETWLPLFEEKGVDLVLNGHDHHYQRFERNGATYVISGAGGRSLREFEPCPEGTPDPIVANHDEYSFVTLEIDGARLTLSAVNIDGERFDRVTIEGD